MRVHVDLPVCLTLTSQDFDSVLIGFSNTHQSSVGKLDIAVILQETYLYLYVWITLLRQYMEHGSISFLGVECHAVLRNFQPNTSSSHFSRRIVAQLSIKWASLSAHNSK